MSRRLPGRAWSVLLAGAAVARATSYLFNPPVPSTTTALIESVIGYSWWACVLLGAATLLTGVIVGSRWGDGWAFVGHLILVGCYTIFAISVLVAAVAYGGTWTTLGDVVVVALLHTERVFRLAGVLGPTSHRREG